MEKQAMEMAVIMKDCTCKQVLHILNQFDLSEEFKNMVADKWMQINGIRL